MMCCLPSVSFFVSRAIAGSRDKGIFFGKKIFLIKIFSGAVFREMKSQLRENNSARVKRAWELLNLRNRNRLGGKVCVDANVLNVTWVVSVMEMITSC